jgi:hypothetical protein
MPLMTTMRARRCHADRSETRAPSRPGAAGHQPAIASLIALRHTGLSADKAPLADVANARREPDALDHALRSWRPPHA